MPIASQLGIPDDNDDGEIMSAESFMLKVRKDAMKKVGKEVEEEKKSKISLPIISGQQVASLEELLSELTNARMANNVPLKVSLLGSIVKKVTSTSEKIKYLEEKFYCV